MQAHQVFKNKSAVSGGNGSWDVEVCAETWGWQLENNAFRDEELCFGVEGQALDDGSCHGFAVKTEAGSLFCHTAHLRSFCVL